MTDSSEKEIPRILHCYADHGVESEALTTYGEVVRVGLKPRPNQSSVRIQADARELPFCDDSFDLGLFHPTCSKWASMTNISGDPDSHPNLIPDARREAQRTCEHWIIENVPQAPLRDPVVLDGKMFGLPIQYARAFETSFRTTQPPRQQTLPTETSTFFYSGHSTEWWRSIKGMREHYPKEHTAKNCLPLPYVHWLCRQWLETTGRAAGVTDYTDYDKRKTAKRRREANESLDEFTVAVDGGSSE